MAILIDKTHKLSEVITEKTNAVLIIFYHGIGDCVMFLSVLERLRQLYPNIKFLVGLCKGLEEELIIPDAVLLEGNWREECVKWNYDIVFVLNFNCEDINDPSNTKAELACIRELGIESVWGHLPIKTKRIVGVSFQCTSVPHVANADENTAKLIWQDIIAAGFVPVEIFQKHVFWNPENVLFPFVDNTIRLWPAKLDTLMAMIAKCDYLISAVGGVFHLGVSILGKDRVMFLEKDIPLGCFTKEKIATANLKDYRHEVLDFLVKKP